MIGFTSLAEMARKTKIPARRLERQLVALNEQPHLRGLVIIQSAPGKKKWVNDAVLDLLQQRVVRTLSERLDDAEGRLYALEIRADECDIARQSP